MRPPLLLDENMPTALAVELRRNGWDAVHANEIGLKRADDPDVLKRAVAERRVVVTYNTKDFILLDKEYRNAGLSHAGILVSPERPIGEMLRRIEQFDWEQIHSNLRHL
jgi:hypothetical protein